MKIYIAGPITNNPDYKKQFCDAEDFVRKRGHSVMNPAWIVPGKEFSYDDYISVSKSMLQVCDGILLLRNWENSDGARKEMFYAMDHNYHIFYDVNHIPDYSKRCYLVCNSLEQKILSRNEVMDFLKITDDELTHVLEKGACHHGYTVDLLV